jgi:hypothetical protein
MDSQSGTVPMPSVVKHLLPASTNNRSTVRCAELRHPRLVVE